MDIKTYLVMAILPLIFYKNPSKTIISYTPKIDDKIFSISGNIQIDGHPADSIEFNIIPEYIYLSLNTQRFIVRCDPAGNFNFKGKTSATFEKCDMIIHSGETKNNILGQYIAGGDHINLIYKVARGTCFAEFSGIGASKYSCNYELQSTLKSGEKPSVAPKNFDAIELLQSTKIKQALRLKQMDAILIRYKRKLPINFYKFTQNNIKGYFINERIRMFILLYGNGKRPDVAQLFKTEFETLRDTTQSNIKAVSEFQINALFQLSKAVLTVKTKGNNFTATEMYDQLKTDYDGSLREKVAIFYLLSVGSKGNSEEYSKCLKDAISFVKSKNAVVFLRGQLERSYSKSTLMDFSMPDSSGKIHHIADFKGKIILIDTWFTGCIYCKLLKKNVDASILPLYKNNKDFVIVSINVDKDKATWLTSLKTGEYTSMTATNLFSAGMAFDHPFIKNYQIVGCPILFLVDRKGILVEFNLSRNPDDMIRAINRELSK